MRLTLKKQAMVRFLELFLTNAAISIILTILNKTRVLSTIELLFWGLVVGSILFFAAQWFFLRTNYYEVRGGKKYYLLNIGVYLVYAILTFIIDWLGFDLLYACLFATTKVIRFTPAWIDTQYSALVFHCIFIVFIFIAPLGEDWNYLFSKRDRRREILGRRK